MDNSEALKKLMEQAEGINKNVLYEIEENMPIPEDKKYDLNYRNELTKTHTHEIEQAKNEVNFGLEAILKELEVLNPTRHAELLSIFAIHLETIGENVMQPQWNKEESSLQKQLMITDEILEAMYAAVLSLDSKKNDEEALSAILVCIQLNSTIFEFWLTYGKLLQKAKQDAAALSAFQVAVMLDEENPLTYASMAKSWLQLNMKFEARNSIKQALTLCEGNENFKELQAYCIALQVHCEANPV